MDEFWTEMLSGTTVGGEENERVESARDPFPLTIEGLLPTPKEIMPCFASDEVETVEDKVSFELKKTPAFKLLQLSVLSDSGSFNPGFVASTALKAKLQNKQGKKSNKIP